MKKKLEPLSVRLLVPHEIRAKRLLEVVQFLNTFEEDKDGTNQTSTKLELVCEDPIFIFSAGWRSGSTLLQRLICSDPSVLIWGEPFGDTIPIPRLAATIGGFLPGNQCNQGAIENFAGKFSDEWIANLNPGFRALRPAHIAYFENFLGSTARQHGFRRWGAKWVRLRADYAVYLKWLYPKAKFIFLVRHPLLAYQSYKGKHWYTLKPDYPVDNVLKFMAHWGYLVNSFLQEWKQVGGLLVRYEDLIRQPQIVDKIAGFLDVHMLQDEVLNQKVGARSNKKPLHWWDSYACRMLAGDACRALGYKLSGEVSDINLMGEVEKI